MQNEVLPSLDTKNPVLLVILDLIVAHDTMDHSILLNHLAQQVGLQGPVLQWFRSYLTDRTFSVMINELSSTPAHSGVPQGSILGPFLFFLYMLPLGSGISCHNLSFHLPVAQNSPDIQSIQMCLHDIKHWLPQNFL